MHILAEERLDDVGKKGVNLVLLVYFCIVFIENPCIKKIQFNQLILSVSIYLWTSHYFQIWVGFKIYMAQPKNINPLIIVWRHDLFFLAWSIKLLYKVSTAVYLIEDNVPLFFIPGKYNAENKCLCNRKCLKYGVIDYSKCKYGFPGYLSFPHFHKADPKYRTDVEGMHPDDTKHKMEVLIEPVIKATY